MLCGNTLNQYPIDPSVADESTELAEGASTAMASLTRASVADAWSRILAGPGTRHPDAVKAAL